jgi:hypothetical protein
MHHCEEAEKRNWLRVSEAGKLPREALTPGPPESGWQSRDSSMTVPGLRSAEQVAWEARAGPAHRRRCGPPERPDYEWVCGSSSS